MSRGRLSLELGPALGWQDLNQRVSGPNCLSQGTQPGSWDSFALARARVVTAALKGESRGLAGP